jgi:hypothetical protein
VSSGNPLLTFRENISVPSSRVKKSKKKSDDVLWNDSEEDGNVRSECEEHEGTGCEDGDSDSDW